MLSTSALTSSLGDGSLEASPELQAILAAAVSAYLQVEAKQAPVRQALPWLPIVLPLPSTDAEPWPLGWYGWPEMESPR